MSGEFLSQDEVDALLQGVAEAPAAAPPPADGVRPFNFAAQERFVRAPMPALDRAHERFARLARLGLFDFVRTAAEVSTGPVRMQKYAEFLRDLVPPLNLNVLRLAPLRGHGLAVFDPPLVHALVDCLFGGDGRFPARVDNREPTPIELRIVGRVLARLLEDYRKAWEPLHPVAFEHLRTETHPQFAEIAHPGDAVVTTSFGVTIGPSVGALHVALPYAALEPIRDKLYADSGRDPREPDARWVRQIQRQVQCAEVELVATLARIEVRLAQIVGMKSGDVIPFELPETVTAEVDGVPVFECRYGTLNGQHALRVERVLAVNQDEPLGGEHG
jgi:flagellar motor switch protein FliM